MIDVKTIWLENCRLTNLIRLNLMFITVYLDLTKTNYKFAFNFSEQLQLHFLLYSIL